MSIPYPRSPMTTVDKFGVSIGGSNTGNGPMMMPKVKWKFRVLFLGFGRPEGTADALSLNTNTVQLPSLTQAPQEIHSYNSRAYYPGKHEWSNCTLVVRDVYDNTVTKNVGRQLQRQLDHYNQTGWRSAADFKFNMQIQQLDGGHDSVVETWFLEQCFLESVTYGDLDYSSSDARTIEMVVRPDNVIIEEFAGGENSIFTNPGNDPLSTTINS